LLYHEYFTNNDLIDNALMDVEIYDQKKISCLKFLMALSTKDKYYFNNLVI